MLNNIIIEFCDRRNKLCGFNFLKTSRFSRAARPYIEVSFDRFIADKIANVNKSNLEPTLLIVAPAI